MYRGIPTTPTSGEVVPNILSPGISYFGGLLYSPPIRFEIVLGGGEVPMSRKGGRHGSSADSARRRGYQNVQPFDVTKHATLCLPRRAFRA